jgi:hypothetical protein
MLHKSSISSPRDKQQSTFCFEHLYLYVHAEHLNHHLIQILALRRRNRNILPHIQFASPLKMKYLQNFGLDINLSKPINVVQEIEFVSAINFCFLT